MNDADLSSGPSADRPADRSTDPEDRFAERSTELASSRASDRSTAGEPSRDEVERLPGLTVLEFGTGWCGICAAAQPLIRAALGARPDVRHLKVEDGRGRPLGRSFGVKLWPTLVVLRDGREAARVVRPHDRAEIDRALAEAG